MTASEETEYVCPECGADIPADAKSCPGCGVVFASGEQEVAAEASPSAWEEAPAPEEGTEAVGFVRGKAEASHGSQAAAEGEGQAHPAEAVPQPPGRRVYEVTLSKLGIAFLVLTAVAIVGTVILMNWDIWVSGASKETVGPRQGLLIAAGFLAIAVGMTVTVYDVLRNRRGAWT